MRAAIILPVLILIVPMQPADAAAPTPLSGAHAAAQPVQAESAVYNNSGLTREVFGYAYASSLGDPNLGYPSWNFDLLSTVAFFAIHVNNQGVLVADSNWTVWNSSTLTGLVTTAHAHGVKVVVTIRGGGAALCGALYGYAATVYQIVAQVQAKGIDGVNIDYEGQLATCPNPNAGGTNYTNQALVTNLAKELRSALDAVKPGYYLSIATYSGSAAGNDGFFNIPDLNQYVDSFFVMAYDMNYSNQRLGPLQNCTPHCLAPESPMANYYWNDTTSMSQYISVVGAAKTILGQPYYGTVACVGSPVAHATATSTVQSATYQDAAAAISSSDVKPGTYAIHRDASDPAGQDRWDTWYDYVYGCWREMYWSDTTTLSVRYDLITQKNLRGVGIWTLSYGGGAAELWRLIQNHFVPCTNTDVVVSPLSPQLSGTQVQLTASTMNCASPRFAFYLRPPGGSWQRLQAYSSNASYTWNSLGKPAGAYWFSVWALAANSPGLYGSPGAMYDSYKAFEYDLTTQPCTAVTASAAPATALMGTAVTVTAVASGCPSPNYLFWLRAPGSVSWRQVQPYSSTPTLNWSTAGQTPGTWGVAVWARDRSSVGTASNIYGSWDAVMSFTYNLTTQPCTGVTTTVSPLSPQLSGTAVSVTAVVTGCPNPQYQFEMLAPGSQTWRIVQPFSPTANFSWSTTGASSGAYKFIVKARDPSSLGTAGNTYGTWDAYVIAPFTLTSQPCTGLTASSAPSGTTTAGTAVTVTGAATGCPNARYQFEMLAPGSQTWQVVQTYSSNAAFNWTTTTGAAKGTYRIIVKARDASSAGTTSNYASSWDAYVSILYTLT